MEGGYSANPRQQRLSARVLRAKARAAIGTSAPGGDRLRASTIKRRARRNFLQDMACRRNPELYERFCYELAQDVQETIDDWLLLNDDVGNVTEPPK